MHHDCMPTEFSAGDSLQEEMPGVAEEGTFERELEQLLNKHSVENDSNTPDFILRGFIVDSLNTFNRSIRQRDQWYSVRLKPASSSYVGSDGQHHPIKML